MRKQMILAAAMLAALVAAPARARECERVYVSNEISGDLSVIDARNLKSAARLSLGKRPRGIKLSPDGRTLYVALSGSPIAPPGVDEDTLPAPDKKADGIGVVDLELMKLDRVLRGISDPEQLAVSADGRRLYVASEDTGRAVVLDATDGAVLASLPVGGEPEGVTISPDGRVVYVTSEADHQVSAIDTAKHQVLARFTVGKRPRTSVFSSDSRLAFVTGENDASITVVDAVRHRPLHTWRLPGSNVRPMGIAISLDGGTLYVATGRAGLLMAVDARNGTVRGSVRTGPRPWGVALASDGKFAYVANGPSNDVAVVDTSTLTVLASIPVGERPWGVACIPETRATRRT